MNYRTLLSIAGIIIISGINSCVNIENMVLFAGGNSSGHVSEYHLDDSLAGIPESEWALYDKVNNVRTDAVYIKGDVTNSTLSGQMVVLFFNARDVCLLSGVTIGKLFRSLGFDFFSLDYRGYGRSYPGFKPSEETLYEDGEAAIRFLTDSLGYADSSIILSGFSLGTGVATDMATRYNVKALILFAAYTNMDNSVETLCGGYDIPADWVLSSKFDNLSKMPLISTPVCFFSGTDDTFVTPDHTKQLFRNANEPKRMYMLQGQDHNKFVTESFSQWKELLLAFIRDID